MLCCKRRGRAQTERHGWVRLRRHFMLDRLYGQEILPNRLFQARLLSHKGSLYPAFLND